MSTPDNAPMHSKAGSSLSPETPPATTVTSTRHNYSKEELLSPSSSASTSSFHSTQQQPQQQQQQQQHLQYLQPYQNPDFNSTRQLSNVSVDDHEEIYFLPVQPQPQAEHQHQPLSVPVPDNGHHHHLGQLNNSIIPNSQGQDFDTPVVVVLPASSSPLSNHNNTNATLHHTTLTSPTTPPSTSAPQEKQPHSPEPPQSRWKAFRLWVIRMATIRRLQLVWGLLALFGLMSWLALMPAYAFRNKLSVKPFSTPSYTFFLVATVGTTISAVWQSVCPLLLIRKSQQLQQQQNSSLFLLISRIIHHPVTQSTTIVVSIIWTVLNFFSWIILAANKEFGAKTSCTSNNMYSNKNAVGGASLLFDSDLAGLYVTQCRGVNTAIVLDAIVFLLWIPVALVMICGTLERRGLQWWWAEDGDDDGVHNARVRGSDKVSSEEIGLKIGAGIRGNKKKKKNAKNDVDVAAGDKEEVNEEEEEPEIEIQRPRMAYVTPIASQFKSSQQQQQQQQQQQYQGYDGVERMATADDEMDVGGSGANVEFIPNGRRYRQNLQQQRQGQLERKASTISMTPSLSSRLSSFFGAGWNHGPMPPASSTTEQQQQQPPVPPIPSQYTQKKSRLGKEHGKASESLERNDKETTGDDRMSARHGDSYLPQWHNRRDAEWS
ncbi:hypothetical protein BG004_006875 [Podila humilis]|nr:hypothetical protein BG004_006875 [Podila humilis]